MTNRAQAKPTKDPLDPIQQQSLLTPILIGAVFTLLTVVWLVYDDFIATKPWKAYQATYQTVAVSFLAEQIHQEREAFEVAPKQARDDLDALLDQILNDQELVAEQERLAEEISQLEKQVKAIDGDVGDVFWMKEQASMLGARKYEKEHGINKWTDDHYRAVLEEVIRRTETTVRLRLVIERYKGQRPELTAAVTRINDRLRQQSTRLRNARQAMEAFTNFKTDFVQVYKSHGGSADIVDRCESCHRGNSEPYLSRDKMWSSHLSNDTARGFVAKFAEKNYYQFKQPRLLQLAEAERTLGPAPQGSFFSNDKAAEVAESGLAANLDSGSARGFMAVPTLASVEAMFRLDDAERNALNMVWMERQAWRYDGMWQDWGRIPEPDPETGAQDPSIAKLRDGEASAIFASDASVALARKHKFARDPGLYEDGQVGEQPQEEFPTYFLTAEAFLWLATEGPYRLDGHMTYPDRFGIGNKPWFQAVVNDPRVVELYKNSYRDFRIHIKENLLMFTAHPRKEVIIDNVHNKEHFGCMSCHRGFGIHAKSVRDAHGNQAHWLVPLFKEGYQEASCQKCHKKDLELAGATRAQEGKMLYQQLGCWSCHSYEGYDAEAGEKLRVAKDRRDGEADLERLNAELDGVMETLATDFALDEMGNTAYASRLMAGGMREELALSESDKKESALRNRQRELERERISLEGSIRDSVSRLAELQHEHKKRGPSLMELSHKIGDENKGWIANWIRYPKGFRPSTRMPHFWYGPFAFLDEKKIVAAGGEAHTAFTDDASDEMRYGNPLYRRYNKQTVDAMKGVSTYIWQAAKVSADLGDSPAPSRHNVPLDDPQAIADGRQLFAQGTGCMSCHSVENDLVKGSAVIPFTTYQPGVEGADSRGFLTEYVHFDGSSDMRPKVFMPAPKYQYRMDGTLAYDGHGNPMTNEFIYGWAANLSRVGEKANPDYLVEWILQPRVRNYTSVMPSFMVDIAGTPPGPQRDAITAVIAQLMGRTDPAGRLLLADARRRRGDITPDALSFYREVLRDQAVLNADVQMRDAMLEQLRRALFGYERAKLIVAYLMTLKHPELSEKGHAHEDNGWIGDYTYWDSVWVSSDESEPEAGDENADPSTRAWKAYMRGELGLSKKPQGKFEKQAVTVTGFGDYSFMDSGYEQFRNARWAQRSAKALKRAAERVRDRAAEAAIDLLPSSRAELNAALTAFQIALDRHQAGLNALAMADGNGAELEFERAALTKQIESANQDVPEILALGGLTIAPDAPRAALAELSQQFGFGAVKLGALDLAGRDYELTTQAGRGRAYTAFYGCAGCHEIEGMETEGKIGVELTEQGSKFWQRLDFGKLEHHAMPEDPLTPESPRWLTRASIRTYDPDHTTIGNYTARTPETLPVVRGGPGYELPAGMRNRYIRSKYDYHRVQPWFQGKVHHPRQWDKGRLLHHNAGWFERTRMPLFELNEHELMAITSFIEGSENLVPWGAGGDSLPANEYIYNYDGSKDDLQKGWWIVHKYNCMGCHSIGPYEGRFRRLSQIGWGAFLEAHGDGDNWNLSELRLVDNIISTPPILADTGSRLRGEWLVNWLREPYDVRNLHFPGPSLMRQWVPGDYRLGGVPDLVNGGIDFATVTDPAKAVVTSRVIMPQFYLTESEARAIHRFLVAIADANPVYVPPKGQSTPEAIAFGEQIFLHGDCLSCHSIDEPVDGVYQPGGKAPNLRNVAQRTRRDWVLDWVRNPDSIQPQGRMYEYFRHDVHSGRWVVRDEVNSLDYRPRVDAGNRNSDLLQYDGDHSAALVAWIFEGLPKQRTSDLQAKLDAMRAKQGGG